MFVYFEVKDSITSSGILIFWIIMQIIFQHLHISTWNRRKWKVKLVTVLITLLRYSNRMSFFFFPPANTKENSLRHWREVLWPTLLFSSGVEAVRMLSGVFLKKCVLTYKTLMGIKRHSRTHNELPLSEQVCEIFECIS